MKKVTAWMVFVLSVIGLLTGCQKKTEWNRYDAQFLSLFDTMTEIVGYETDKDTFTKNVTLLHDELERYHQLYDIYHDYEGIANIKTINDNAGRKPVKVEREIIDLLLLGKDMYEVTGGKVNIAYGSVLSIWHDYRSQGLDDPLKAALPTVGELEEAGRHVDMEDVIIDEEASTVYLEDPEMSLDVGSLGKGYAVEKITDFAVEHGMDHLLISVGGNISAIGTKADGSSWKLGIQNPDEDAQEAYIRKVNMENQSLVTSGDYQRYYIVDGKKYHHIINPDTRMPADYFAAVSILNERSGIADALSTAVYNMPLEAGKALIESLPDTEAMWVYHDGTLDFSSGFEKYIAR